MNVNYAKFQKSLIVEQFQGNYLNCLPYNKIITMNKADNLEESLTGQRHDCHDRAHCNGEQLFRPCWVSSARRL